MTQRLSTRTRAKKQGLPNTSLRARGTPYRCSQCGCVEQTEVVDVDALRRLPLPESLKPNERWRVCPDEGPEDIDLYNPTDATERWERWSFDRNGKTIRTCIRAVRGKPFTRDNRERVRIGRALPFGNVIAEWGVRDHIYHIGTTDRPSIEALWMFQGHHIGRPMVARDKAGRWVLARSQFLPVGEWQLRLYRSPALRRLDPERRYFEDARALVESLSPNHPFSAEARGRSELLVPIDLRLSLDDQLNTLRGDLSAIQDVFLGIAGRVGPYRTDDDAHWCNVYCLFLLERGGLTSPEAAAEAFPDHKTGANKVRRYASRARKALTHTV